MLDLDQIAEELCARLYLLEQQAELSRTIQREVEGQLLTGDGGALWIAQVGARFHRLVEHIESCHVRCAVDTDMPILTTHRHWIVSRRGTRGERLALETIGYVVRPCAIGAIGDVQHIDRV